VLSVVVIVVVAEEADGLDDEGIDVTGSPED